MRTVNGGSNLPPVADNPYTDAFYTMHADAVSRSAQIAVPLVLELIRPRSVIDIGCGRGAWLRAFADNGVSEIRGLDGDYVDRVKLMIDPARFSAVDLRESFEIQGHYDLALCLEVAEHLPASRAPELVRSLAAAAPAVLFSAAIPGQGGTDHVNEQWPNYWRKLFADCGLRMLDPIRPHIVNDARVEWWYRQNLLMFASEAAILANPALAETASGDSATGIEWIHVNSIHPPTPLGVRGAMRELRRAAWRSLMYRLGRPIA